jgi:hypothetical protein
MQYLTCKIVHNYQHLRFQIGHSKKYTWMAFKGYWYLDKTNSVSFIFYTVSRP